ncbi:MAG: saccharopine dehydrogenase NADP-binding domain-containing protein [Bacteroidales bacterium]|nr:saccharopine dehydrogenase NADP-binding domain-containing protein [Bacteroidales bacterium]
MKQILILGAGFSSTVMIKYLLEKSVENNWKITVGDVSLELAEKKVNHHPNGRAIAFDINNEEQKQLEIGNADVVISFLPAMMHPIVARECLKQGKNMLTASYVSPEMKALAPEVKQKGLIFLNELGVDPGIDHMSAMKVIDHIRSQGGIMKAFYSNTGGLIAPESDNNPWHYKFTWNPRNVIVAGQGTAKYFENGTIKYIPYQQLFKRTFRVKVLDLGEFDVYANRDSLSYREVYGLQDIPTIFRGTMRRPGYCQAWNIFVQLGMTDDTYIVENSENITYRDFINMYLPYDNSLTVEEKVCKIFNLDMNSQELHLLKWSGIFEKNIVGLKDASPAKILQKLLEEKWRLEPGDKDMIVMQHIFKYEINQELHQITSSLVVKGKNEIETSMAITVGMPVAFATEMLLKGEINLTGVHTPVIPELYNPILSKLEQIGIHFIEEHQVIN